jgi:hypothetical protein
VGPAPVHGVLGAGLSGRARAKAERKAYKAERRAHRAQHNPRKMERLQMRVRRLDREGGWADDSVLWVVVINAEQGAHNLALMRELADLRIQMPKLTLAWSTMTRTQRSSMRVCIRRRFRGSWRRKMKTGTRPLTMMRHLAYPLDRRGKRWLHKLRIAPSLSY